MLESQVTRVISRQVYNIFEDAGCGLVERLQENLADFKQNVFQKTRILYQDVTCYRSI